MCVWIVYKVAKYLGAHTKYIWMFSYVIIF